MSVFIGGSARAMVTERAAAQSLQGLVSTTDSVAALVHCLQAERGATNTFVTSRGRLLATELHGLRAATDAARETLTTRLASHDDAATRRALDALAGLADRRQSADVFAQAPTQYVASYTAWVRGLLDSTHGLTGASTDAAVTRDLVALVSLLEAKERMGLVRANLAAAFAQDRFSTGQRLKVAGLVSARDAYLDEFAKVGGKVTATTATDLTGIARTRGVTGFEARALARATGFGVDPTQWFAAASGLIDEMRRSNRPC